jgi:hypothetical protein
VPSISLGTFQFVTDLAAALGWTDALVLEEVSRFVPRKVITLAQLTQSEGEALAARMGTVKSGFGMGAPLPLATPSAQCELPLTEPVKTVFMRKEQKAQIVELAERLGHNVDWANCEAQSRLEKGLGDFTEDDAHKFICWLNGELGKADAARLTRSPEDISESLLAGAIYELTTLAGSDAEKRQGVEWLSSCDAATLEAYVRTLPASMQATIAAQGANLNAVRLAVARAWLGWAKDAGVPAAAATLAAEAAATAPTTNPYAEMQVPGDAAKVTMEDFVAEPVHARDAIKGRPYMVRKCIGWATGDKNAAGEALFLLPSRIVLGVGADVMACEVRVSIKTKDDTVTLEPERNTPRLVGRGARTSGICDVFWLGAWAKTQAKVTDQFKDEKVTIPAIGVALIGKDPAKRQLKVFDWDGEQVTIPSKKEIGDGQWDALGRLALEAMDADLGVKVP